MLEAVGRGVEVAVGLIVGVDVAVAFGEVVGRGVEVDVGDGEVVGRGELLAVGVGETVGVADAVGDGDVVGVAVIDPAPGHVCERRMPESEPLICANEPA